EGEPSTNTVSSVASDLTSAPETLLGCQPAPGWLVTTISRGILVRGAYLSNTYVGSASGFSAGPSAVFTAHFATAWWLAGRLNGVGVQPELAVWVTNRTVESATGEIFAVNSPARRYSDWGSGGSDQIAGDGLQPVQDCVGPMP